jgi:glycine/D-amino acid oxidase-like deaminating enzyme
MIDEFDSDGIPVLKVGGHLIRTKIDFLKTVWQQELSQEEIDWSKQNTADYLKALNLHIELSDLRFIKGNSCVYSMTESEVPYVTHILATDTNPDPNFVVMAGMSGVGAKGSLAYGLIAANLLLGKDESTLGYQITKNALGIELLLKGLSHL